MKKRIISILTLVCLLLGSVPFTLSASAVGLEVLTYEIVDGEVTITDCDITASGDLVIPSEVAGYPVTKISDSAFDGCAGVTSITIPESVTYISSYGFDGCIGLESITVAEGNAVYRSEGNCLIEKETNALILSMVYLKVVPD